ncbi:MAG: OmpH family outer membrane protein [Candidatus Obscuribacterales bacterium]|nr:OmpH family outer membrane protein [Candidatus Obscuribacterales bacterium]
MCKLFLPFVIFFSSLVFQSAFAESEKDATDKNEPQAINTAVSTPAPAGSSGKSAETIFIRLGYFDSHEIKASYAPCVIADKARANARQTIEQMLEKNNRELQDMHAEGKSKSDIAKRAEQLQIELNAQNNIVYALAAVQVKTAREKLGAAVVELAKERDLDVIVDAATVWQGAQLVGENGMDVTGRLLKQLGLHANRPAGGAAKAFSVKIGFFDMRRLERRVPKLSLESAGNEAEAQMSKKVTELNAELREAQHEGKSREEIERMAADMQGRINDEQKAFLTQIQTVAEARREVLKVAIRNVSEKFGTEMVLDSAGVYAGEALLTSKCVDLTEALFELLK